MRIAICGGTGDIGAGLALRWAYHTNHEVVIGSRDPERAREKADEYETELDSRGVEAEVAGFENAMAADRADVVVLAVPAYHLSDTVESIADRLRDQVLVTPAVGMKRDDDGLHYNPPPAGSVASIVADAAPEGTPVVGAFHNIPAGRLADLDADFDWDTVVVGDDADAKERVMGLAEDIDGLRALDGGPLANASEVEAITPLLVNLAQRNDTHTLGVKFQ